MNSKHLLRQLPAISFILESEVIKKLKEEIPHALVVEASSEVIEQIRQRVLTSADDIQLPELDDILKLITQKAMSKARQNLRRVINATGIVLHTNLGRALLAPSAVMAIENVAGNYSNLELEIETGERGTRYAHIEELLCRLTGAEAGMIVNNNAAAVLLVLNTLAQGREVVVSRGQLVEIGGSFRIPDVMTQSGAILREVGTTNKTHPADYHTAINEGTALLLKVHTSNYKIIGFTSEVSLSQLVEMGHDKGIPVYEDLGSGMLLDMKAYGIPTEPTVRDSVDAGVDVITCSGDKLFGGPQAGLVVGKKELIAKLKRNPLTRALRVDKFTLAAMEATLRLYLDEDKATQEIPTLRMITMSLDHLRAAAEELAEKIKAGVKDIEVSVIEGYSQVGGGTLPEHNLPTYLVSLKPKELSVNRLESKLRELEPPVLARIQQDSLLLDSRTLINDDFALILQHLRDITGKI